MITEKVLEELEADVRLRKRLAELLITEPDIRLALINAIIADVATKKDINELRTELKNEISDVRKELSELRKELKNEISELRGEVNQLRGEMHSNFRWIIGVVLTVWGATVIPILLRLIGAI
ncbi:MAG: hypothetical protein ACP5GU_02260 [Thermoprotei archaeon]